MAPESKNNPKSNPQSFGEIAIKADFINRQQLVECLDIQSKMVEMGIQSKPIGQILYDKNYISSEQAHKIFHKQSAKSENAIIAGFRIIKKLGEGSMGTVYKAMQISLDRAIALKTINLKYSKKKKFRERFFKEAQAVAMLNHENIVAGYDVGEECGIAYFAMEYIDGPSAQKLIDKSGRIEENIALNIILQIARALKHAHQHGMVHRDIKPDNILINKAGIAKLCDLGLALVKTDHSSKKEGRVVGTPLFISPEQASGTGEIDIRSDIYSLGASFYYMITGQTPFTGEFAREVLKKHIEEELVPPREILPNISVAANEAISIMMEKDPKDRYQTPDELVHDLQGLLHARDEKIIQKKLDIEEQKSKAIKPKKKVVRRYRLN